MILKILLPLLAAAGAAAAVAEALHSEQVAPPVAPAGAMPEAPFAQAIAGAGLVEASTENISVGSTSSGVVTKIRVKLGDRVKAGQPLFELDARALNAALAQKRAALQSAKVAVANAKYDYRVSADLTAKHVNTENDRDEKRFALEKAESAVAEAQADLDATQTSIDLLTIKSPVDGEILQLKLHVGEFAPDSSTVAAQPAILMGSTAPLNVRAEFNEDDAWRVRSSATAVGFVRGNAQVKIPLTFVRFEPYVVPKASLTGASTERVDTRVLEVIYALGKTGFPVYAGQQLDVFLDAAPAGQPPQR